MEQHERLKLLIKDEGLEKLSNAKVLIVGVGGVGGYAAESLARCNIKELVLMDHDDVSITNLNRQIIATYDSVGQDKAELMKARIETFSKTKVTCLKQFYDENTDIIDDSFDYVIDACDTLSAKLAIVQACHKHKVKCIHSLGMANRLDPSQIYETTLDKTSNDALAKAFRQVVKKSGIKHKIKVILSKETAYKQNELVNPDGKTLKEKYPPSSAVFVPAAAGLLLGSIVVREIIGVKK